MSVDNILNEIRYQKKQSTCKRRQVGAVITTNGNIISSGHNHTIANECDNCPRVLQNAKSGEMLDLCYAIHAEQDALMKLIDRNDVVIDDTTIMYITHKPCSNCAKLIIRAGIKKVQYDDDYPSDFTDELFKQAGVEIL